MGGASVPSEGRETWRRGRITSLHRHVCTLWSSCRLRVEWRGVAKPITKAVITSASALQTSYTLGLDSIFVFCFFWQFCPPGCLVFCSLLVGFLVFFLKHSMLHRNIIVICSKSVFFCLFYWNCFVLLTAVQSRIKARKWCCCIRLFEVRKQNE